MNFICSLPNSSAVTPGRCLTDIGYDSGRESTLFTQISLNWIKRPVKPPPRGDFCCPPPSYKRQQSSARQPEGRKAQGRRGQRQNRLLDRGSELVANEPLARFDPFDHRRMAGFEFSTQRGVGEDYSVLAVERPSVPDGGRNDVDLKWHARRDAL